MNQLEQFTIGFYGDSRLKAILEQWAREEDRSVSSVIRRLIEAEHQRRTPPQPQPKMTSDRLESN